MVHSRPQNLDAAMLVGSIWNSMCLGAAMNFSR